MFIWFFLKGEVNKCQGLQIDKDGKPVRNPEVSKGQDIYKYIEHICMIWNNAMSVVNLIN